MSWDSPRKVNKRRCSVLNAYTIPKIVLCCSVLHASNLWMRCLHSFYRISLFSYLMIRFDISAISKMLFTATACCGGYKCSRVSARRCSTRKLAFVCRIIIWFENCCWTEHFVLLRFFEFLKSLSFLRYELRCTFQNKKPLYVYVGVDIYNWVDCVVCH